MFIHFHPFSSIVFHFHPYLDAMISNMAWKRTLRTFKVVPGLSRTFKDFQDFQRLEGLSKTFKDFQGLSRTSRRTRALESTRGPKH